MEGPLGSLVSILGRLFPEPVHTLGWGEGGGKLGKGSGYSSEAGVFFSTEYSWTVPSIRGLLIVSEYPASFCGPVTVPKNTRQLLDRVCSEAFPEYFCSRISCPRISSTHQTHPGMHQPAEKNDHALIEHVSRQSF